MDRSRVVGSGVSMGGGGGHSKKDSISLSLHGSANDAAKSYIHHISSCLLLELPTIWVTYYMLCEWEPCSMHSGMTRECCLAQVGYVIHCYSTL